MEEPSSPPADEDGPRDEDPSASRLARAGAVAAALLRHKELLVAAMEMLRAKQAVSDEDEVKVLAAYERGDAAVRASINDLLEKLQKANFGKVLLQLSLAAQAPGGGVTRESVAAAVRPALAAGAEQVRAEVRPYLEQARAKLLELKALEEPTLRRLEVVGADLADAGRELAKGLKGAGREAADELVRRGKRWWMDAETEELEREFFDWTLRMLPRAETVFVRVLIGFGLLLLVSGVLIAAQEFTVLERLATYLAIFLLVALGLAFLNWGIRVSEALRSGRSEIERLAAMTPVERRRHLARRWTERAQREGIIDSTEAQDVLKEVVEAAPEGTPPPAGPTP